MSNHNSYFKWHGRIDQETPTELSQRVHQKIHCPPKDDGGIVFIGYNFDLGVQKNQGRIGAVEGPNHIRGMLASLPWQDKAIHDFGDICSNEDSVDAAQQKLADSVQLQLEHKRFPIVLGGGHDLAYGSWLGAKQYLSSTQQHAFTLGSINFDAHFDLRSNTNGNSSGTPFYQIAQQCKEQAMDFRYLCLGVAKTANTHALFHRADALDVQYRYDFECTQNNAAQLIQDCKTFMQQCDFIHLSIDLDAFPASIAPGVSAPSILGIELATAERLIDTIKQSGKLILADIAECNPKFDTDAYTARLATRIIHKIVE